MRIDIAYCVELDQVVDIQKACQAFMDQNTLKEFHFLCSHPTCRHSKSDGVRVSAINHYKLPEEQGVNPHYRKWDEHITDCEWVELEEAQAEANSSLDNKNSTCQHLKLLGKIKRLITHFVIPEEEDDNSKQNLLQNALENIRVC